MDGVAGRRKITNERKGSSKKAGGGNLSQKGDSERPCSLANECNLVSGSAKLANRSAKEEVTLTSPAEGGLPKSESLVSDSD